MLTARGSLFLVAVFALLTAAVAFAATALALVCLTLLVWFLGGWFLFHVRLRTAQRRLVVDRAIETPHGRSESVWARQRLRVHVTLRIAGGPALPYLVLSDRLPPLARLLAGSPQADGELAAEAPLELAYEIECAAPGKLRFDGSHVQLADLHGFYTDSLFVRDVREYRVLPALAAEPAHPTFVKQQNALPLLGKHRFLRPGTGSELLDLRDYMPGDPPKMVAWKASARRGKLMTRELESEVPIRCTLFIDTSDATRVGPPGRTPLCRAVEIAAGVAQANSAERDLTGLCLFDDRGVRLLMRPARGPKHFLKVVRELADAAALVPRPRGVPLPELLAYGYGLAQDVYPELLHPDVNHVPWWLPLWAPQPVYTVARPPIEARTPEEVPGTLVRRLWRATVGLRWRRGSRFSRRHRRLYRWRKQLAAILSVRYDLGPGGLSLLLEDDEACGRYVRRFLAEHQVACPAPLYDEEGRYVYRSKEKVDRLAAALLSAVTRGKDNELFVLLVDLLESGPDVARLERAVLLALARHHQVVVVCPWPEAVPLPPRSGGRAHATSLPAADLGWQELILRASATRLHQAFGHVRHTFGRLGVPVICAAAEDTVDLVLYRLQRLRVHQRGVR